jgi:hypothetical protein
LDETWPRNLGEQEKWELLSQSPSKDGSEKKFDDHQGVIAMHQLLAACGKVTYGPPTSDRQEKTPLSK